MVRHISINRQVPGGGRGRRKSDRESEKEGKKEKKIVENHIFPDIASFMMVSLLQTHETHEHTFLNHSYLREHCRKLRIVWMLTDKLLKIHKKNESNASVQCQRFQSGEIGVLRKGCRSTSLLRAVACSNN